MAALMLAGAKLGDIFGRDKTFAIGLAVYGVGSLTTALSPNLAVLLVGWSLHRGDRRRARDAGDRLADRRHLHRQAAGACLRDRRRRRGRRDRRRAADRRLGHDRAELALRLRRRDGDRHRDPAAAPPAADAAARSSIRPQLDVVGVASLGARARAGGIRHPQEQRVGSDRAPRRAHDRRRGDHAVRLLGRAVPDPRRRRLPRRRSPSGRSGASARAATRCSIARC